MLQEHGVKVLSIGKIYDLYAGAGIDETFTSKSNAEGMAAPGRAATPRPARTRRLILLNLVDFDMLWGHRNDPAGHEGGPGGIRRLAGALPGRPARRATCC